MRTTAGQYISRTIIYRDNPVTGCYCQAPGAVAKTASATHEAGQLRPLVAVDNPCPCCGISRRGVSRGSQPDRGGHRGIAEIVDI